jgi:hypothetical protein
MTRPDANSNKRSGTSLVIDSDVRTWKSGVETAHIPIIAGGKRKIRMVNILTDRDTDILRAD